MSKAPRPSLMYRFLYRLSGRLRCRIINGNDGEPYLERYYLFGLPGGRHVYLHRFVDSDPDRGLHDHPWRRSIGWVLSGGYRELRLVRDDHGGERIAERHMRPGRINLIRDTDFHRIVLPPGHSCWTLFAHGRKRKDWGFLSLDPRGRRHYVQHEQATNEAPHDEWWQRAPRGRLTPRQAL